MCSTFNSVQKLSNPRRSNKSAFVNQTNCLRVSFFNTPEVHNDKIKGVNKTIGSREIWSCGILSILATRDSGICRPQVHRRVIFLRGVTVDPHWLPADPGNVQVMFFPQVQTLMNV